MKNNGSRPLARTALLLANRRIQGEDNLGGLGLSPDAGIAAAFRRKFESLFDDEKVAGALK